MRHLAILETRAAATFSRARSLPALAGSGFNSLKKERVKKQIYKNRELAKAGVADYIDSFYNRARPLQNSREFEKVPSRSFTA